MRNYYAVYAEVHGSKRRAKTVTFSNVPLDEVIRPNWKNITLCDTRHQAEETAKIWNDVYIKNSIYWGN